MSHASPLATIEIVCTYYTIMSQLSVSWHWWGQDFCLCQDTAACQGAKYRSGLGDTGKNTTKATTGSTSVVLNLRSERITILRNIQTSCRDNQRCSLPSVELLASRNFIPTAYVHMSPLIQLADPGQRTFEVRDTGSPVTTSWVTHKSCPGEAPIPWCRGWRPCIREGSGRVKRQKQERRELQQAY